MNEDIERHPELSPILQIGSTGNIECLGWTSPVYSFDYGSFTDLCIYCGQSRNENGIDWCYCDR